MNHRVGRLVFGLGVGLLLALLAFRWATDSAPRTERQVQESLVVTSRALLTDTLAVGPLEIVDPVAPDRRVGKVYVYRSGDGWEVSGYYRRSDKDLWHPYLLSLDASFGLMHLKVSDPALMHRNQDGSLLEVLP